MGPIDTTKRNKSCPLGQPMERLAPPQPLADSFFMDGYVPRDKFEEQCLMDKPWETDRIYKTYDRTTLLMEVILGVFTGDRPIRFREDAIPDLSPKFTYLLSRFGGLGNDKISCTPLEYLVDRKVHRLHVDEINPNLQAIFSSCFNPSDPSNEERINTALDEIKTKMLECYTKQDLYKDLAGLVHCAGIAIVEPGVAAPLVSVEVADIEDMVNVNFPEFEKILQENVYYKLRRIRNMYHQWIKDTLPQGSLKV